MNSIVSSKKKFSSEESELAFFKEAMFIISEAVQDEIDKELLKRVTEENKCYKRGDFW